MPERVGGHILLLDGDGPAIAEAADIVEAFHAEDADAARWVAVPITRLDPAFFDLRSGVAGDIAQACANYRIGLAIVGDIAGHIAASRPFAAFVRESERGRHIRFVADEAELRTRLGNG